MPSTYTSRLRLTLPATGELTNVWGNTVNSGITELVESSIAGAATLSTWGGAGVAYTLSNNNGVADEARCMFLVASGAPGENKNIICPAVTKLYVVRNNVSGGFSVTLKTSAGTGITVPNGTTMFLRCDGTDVVDALTRVDNFQAATLGVSGTTTLSGLTASTALALNGSKEVVSVTNTGTGNNVLATSPTLTTPTVTGPTVSTGNLTFSSTAQRITGDFSNATVANRLMFQTSTTNGNTSVAAIPNGTSVQANIRAFANSDPTNASFTDIGADPTVGSFLRAERTGTGTYLPMTFFTGGSERVRVDTSGNVGIGAASPGFRLDVSGTARFTGITRFDNAIDLKTATLNYVYFDDALAFARNGVGERMRIDASGNVGIGRAPNYKLDVYIPGTGSPAIASSNDSMVTVLQSVGSTQANVGTLTSHPLVFIAANTERMRIDASGNVNISTLGARITGDFTNATVANRLTFQTSTANSTTSVAAIPSGSGTVANFSVVNNSTPTNASVGLFQATSTVIAITSSATGSGTTLPITFNVPGEVARIDTSGNVIQGTAAVATTATAGFLWITSCAGVPTGAPTAPYTNAAAMVCDTTNNRLYVRVAGTWRYATLT